MKAKKDLSSPSKEIVETLNDLIQINRDRVRGYEKAVENLEEGDAVLRTLFYQLSDESQKLTDDLSSHVVALGGEPAKDTTMSGKIYRAWMEVRDAFSSDDTRTALESCEYGEDAAQKAYSQALDESTSYPAEIRTLIQDQKDMLRVSHDLVRNKRDQYEAAVDRAH